MNKKTLMGVLMTAGVACVVIYLWTHTEYLNVLNVPKDVIA